MRVEPSEGRIQKINGQWKLWCLDHAPRVASPSQSRTVRRLTAAGEVVTPREPQNLDVIRAMPGARFEKTGSSVDGGPFWRVSLDMGDRRRLLELADRIALVVDPELRRIPEHPRVVAARLDGRPRDYQLAGIEHLATRSHALLGDDMGLGKTLQVLFALPERAAAIIVCPSSLKWNWAAEAKTWRPDLNVNIRSGRDSFVWPRQGELVIVNYEILPEQPGHRPTGYPIALVTDESHRVKNRKSQRAQRVLALSKACNTVWAITGTPLLNRPLDLWNVLEAHEMARMTFNSWTKFVELFNGGPGEWGGVVWGTPKPVVPEMLRRVMLRRTRREVLSELPDETVIDIPLPIADQKLARCLDAIAGEMGADFSLEGIRGNRVAFEELSRVRAELSEARWPVVEEIVEDNEENEVPLLVFSAYRHCVDRLDQREGWAAITGDTPAERRQQIVDDFQAGKLKGVALTITAGGVGLTLTRAWRVLFVDLDWVPANNAQAAARVNRIGQTSNRIEILRLIADHPVDRRVVQLLDHKRRLVDCAVETSGSVVAEPPSPPQETDPISALVALTGRTPEQIVSIDSWISSPEQCPSRFWFQESDQAVIERLGRRRDRD